MSIRKEDKISSDVIEKNEFLKDVCSALGIYIGRNKKNRNCCTLIVTIVGLLSMQVITKKELLAKLTDYYDDGTAESSCTVGAAPLPARISDK